MFYQYLLSTLLLIERSDSDNLSATESYTSYRNKLTKNLIEYVEGY